MAHATTRNRVLTKCGRYQNLLTLIALPQITDKTKWQSDVIDLKKENSTFLKVILMDESFTPKT